MATTDKMEQISIIYRGKIMQSVSYLEKMMDVFIGEFFCRPDRVNDMTMFVLGDNRMALENKRQVFRALSLRYYKTWFDSFDNKGAGLNNCLIDIIEKRNVFAHLAMSIDEEARKDYDKTGSITFLRFKDDLKPFRFNDEDISELNELILSVSHFILEGAKKHLREKQ